MHDSIWVFREMRSGGTWLCNFLAKALEKRHIFLEHHSQLALNMKASPLHSKYLFSTHKLEYMKPVINYHNPLIIRCARKDKFEQMLSEFFFAVTNRAVSNIYSETDKIRFDNISKIQSIKVSKNDVHNWIDRNVSDENQWKEFSKNLTVHAVYYEDFIEGTTIDGIDLLLKFDESITEKLPNYKESVFVNYDEIKEWFNEYNAL